MTSSYDPDNPNATYPLNTLQREVQQLKSQVQELSSRDHRREAELLNIRECLERKGWQVRNQS